MTRYEDDEAFEHELDPEGPSADDIERFGSEIVACPNCHGELYDELTTCPHCGHIFDALGGKGVPAWVKLAGLAVLGAFVLYFVL